MEGLQGAGDPSVAVPLTWNILTISTSLRFHSGFSDHNLVPPALRRWCKERQTTPYLFSQQIHRSPFTFDYFNLSVQLGCSKKHLVLLPVVCGIQQTVYSSRWTYPTSVIFWTDLLDSRCQMRNTGPKKCPSLNQKKGNHSCIKKWKSMLHHASFVESHS